MTEPVTVAFAPGSLEGWLGGTNYLGNLLRAVADNPQAGVRPLLAVGSETPDSAIEGMPAAEVVRTPLFDRRRPGRVASAVARRLVGRDPLLERLLLSRDASALSHSSQIWQSRELAMIAWIADFQHVRLPQLFSRGEQRDRDRVFRRLIERSTLLILSSESALADLAEFAPERVGKARVLRFVSEAHATEATSGPEAAMAAHGIAGPYLFLPNQFWVHKNHAVVVEALGILRRRGVEANVVATGDRHDHRNPDHFERLARRVEELGVGDSFTTLGRIDYADVVGLMRGAEAVLNPSLCEGWSTSVEEAKSLGKRTILSDIDVHREQAPPGAAYFEPDDPEALAGLIERVLAGGDPGGDREREQSAAAELPERRRGYAEAYGAIIAEAVELTKSGA